MNQTVIDRLNTIRLFLLDLDGTVYLGTTPVPGAVDFINRLKSTGKDYVFMTNNSSKSAADYIEKLTKLGFPVTERNILTSGQVTGWYLENEKPGAHVYVVGTESLKKELSLRNIRIVDGGEQADCVVVGFDTGLTYQKLLHACDYLNNGADFIATNPDLVCPVGGGCYIPDCGSICQCITHAVKREAVFIGKPHTKLVDFLKAGRTVSRTATAVVGDRLYTDIALGCNAGIMSICTLTGEADRAAIKASDYRPDCVVESVAELLEVLAG